MMNKITLRWALIAFAILTPLLYAWYINYQRNHYECEAHTTVVDDNYILDVIADYSFDGGEGIYQTSGEYIEKGQPSVSISNKVAFNYWREAGSIIMVSSETNERPKKNQPYRVGVPDFFHVRDRGLKFRIVPANSSSYLFIYGHAPVFYCTKG